MQPENNSSARAFVSIAEWCRVSGMGMTSAYAALGRGDLTAIKLGRKTLVNLEDGLAWLRSQERWRPARVPAAEPEPSNCRRRVAE